MKPIPMFIPLRRALKNTVNFNQMKMSRSLWYSGSNRNLGSSFQRESISRNASASVAMGIIIMSRTDREQVSVELSSYLSVCTT